MSTTVVIEKGASDTYSMYLDVEGIGANGVGNTFDEAYQDLLECMDGVVDFLKEENKKIPAYLKTRKFVFVYDIAALLEHFSWINTTELAKRIRVSPPLMRHYKSRTKFASKKQLLKIQEGIREIGRELTEINLVLD